MLVHLTETIYLMNFYSYTVSLDYYIKYFIFYYNIFALGKNNKVQEATALWTQMQEEDIQPSDNFMWSLSELLKNNNLEVPFTVNKPKENKQSSIPSDVKQNLTSQLDTLIENNNISKALSLRKIIHSRGLSINPNTESKIIDLLLHEDKLDEAFEICKNMLNNNRPITKHILRFLVVKLSEAGDVASLKYLDGKMSKV